LDDARLPPSLAVAAPLLRISHAARTAAAALSAATEHGGFRVFLDDACGMPEDWRLPVWERVANASSSYISKYGPEFLIPRMIDASPFATLDWRRANASVVVLFGNKYGGPFLAMERCRRTLSERSAAWRVNDGARHFFIAPSDYGPCAHTGHMMSANMLRHHVIAIHGEMEGQHWHWGIGPDLPCFVPEKDISIPPSSQRHRPPPLPQGPTPRDLLAIFIGAGEMKASLTHGAKRAGRALMLKYWGGGKDPAIRAHTHLPHAEFVAGLRRAKFCPLFGGNSPWTTRLVEAIMNGCVPVIFSSWLPPFSRLLRWEDFSVHLSNLTLVPHLKSILEARPYESLSSNLARVRGALWYHPEPSDSGSREDMLPFLLVEMQLALRSAATYPLHVRASNLVGLPLQHAVYYDDDERLRPDHPLNETLPNHVVEAVRRGKGFFAPQYRGGVTLVTNRSAHRGLPTCEVVIRCVAYGNNGHSYPFPNGVSDPYAPGANLTLPTLPKGVLAEIAMAPYYGPIETRCKPVGTSVCSRSETIRRLKLLDPIPATQSPPKGWIAEPVPGINQTVRSMGKRPHGAG